MKRTLRVVVLASSLLALVPTTAGAQCEGGTQVAGYYAAGSSVYTPGGCSYTNPTTPQQLYPSGAQPLPSTNPALGASRLPGQSQPSDLIPVNSSDLGPAPSLTNPLTGVANVPSLGGTGAGLGAGQLPSSGTPALTGNRADPSNTVLVGNASPFSTGPDPSGAYTYSLPAAPVLPEAPDPDEPPAPARGGSTVIGE